MFEVNHSFPANLLLSNGDIQGGENKKLLTKLKAQA